MRKAGHCEHFATALTVLLRARGIPARVVSGFYGGERLEGVAETAPYVLRAGDAHAWTEAYLDGRWTRFDATPDDSRGVQATALAERLSRAYEWVDAFWRAHVVDFSLLDQMGAIHAVTSHARPVRARVPTPDGHWAGFVFAAVGVGLLIFGVVELRRGVTHEASRLLARAERLLERHGVPLPPGTGLEELAQALVERRHPAALAARTLTRRYLEARFGHRPLLPGEARTLLRALSVALGASEAHKQEARA